MFLHFALHVSGWPCVNHQCQYAKYLWSLYSHSLFYHSPSPIPPLSLSLPLCGTYPNGVSSHILENIYSTNAYLEPVSMIPYLVNELKISTDPWTALNVNRADSVHHPPRIVKYILDPKPSPRLVFQGVHPPFGRVKHLRHPQSPSDPLGWSRGGAHPPFGRVKHLRHPQSPSDPLGWSGAVPLPLEG